MIDDNDIKQLTHSILTLAGAIQHLGKEDGQGRACTLRDIIQTEKNISHKLDKIMAAIDDANAALAKIDAATTKIATNIQTEAAVIQTISDELDALVAAGPGQGIPAEFLTKLTAVANGAQASSDALDAQVPVLQAIAAKGATNPVPVPVPPPSPAPTP